MSDKFDSIVDGFTSLTLTPPFVMIASLKSRSPFNVNGKALISRTNFSRSSFVISFTFLSGSIPDNPIMTGIIFAGKSFPMEFLNCLFFASSKSFNTRLSNCSSVNAGFKSISIARGSFAISGLIIALAVRINGPLTPKMRK